MGYSEVYCHICGVSFNIGRLRAPHEQRTAAWDGSGYRDGVSFVTGGRNSWIGECRRDAGCMLVYRQDQARENRQRKHAYRGDGGRSETDERGGTRLGLVQEEEEDGSCDESYGAGGSGYESEGGDGESMDYEYETPPGSCNDADAGDDSDDMAVGDSMSDIKYRNFVQKVRKSSAILTGKSPAVCHTELENLRKVEALLTQPEDEVMLPLFRPLPGRDEDDASMHGSDASFECDEPDGSCARSSRKTKHWWTGKLSSWGHPLNGDEVCDDYTWEHLAGPGCLNVHGYNGNRISVEEMQGCNTSQALISKADVEGGWQPGEYDESWEQGCTFFLSGLDDHMPSRDMGSPNFYPDRNGFGSIDAENVRWNVGPRADGTQYAMPFHPTCLEVYKRACLRRYGSIKVEALASWWLMTTTYEEFNKGRSDAVKESQEQEWQHTPGNEFLAANPCVVPGLNRLLESTRRAAAENGEASFWSRQLPKSSSFEALPAEIHRQIFGCLTTVEVAKTCLAAPGIRALAQALVLDRLLVEYPHLWELWCDKPYSQWVGTTAGELQSARQAFDQRRKEVERVLEVLKEEGHDETRIACEQYWSADHEERQKTITGSLCSEKLVIFLEEGKSNFAQFAVDLAAAVERNQVKGLKNRERIWTQCQRILDRVEEFRREGKIGADGSVLHDALAEVL